MIRSMFGVLSTCALLSVSCAFGQTCEESAKSIAGPEATLVKAYRVEAGKLTPPGQTKAPEGLPTLCLVMATLTPTPESRIGIEVWMPEGKAWNGKYMAVGSGGWGGSIAHGAMAEAVRRGYATSATDDGHEGSSASFIMGHPERLVDFAYRAEHLMAVDAKKLIAAYYGQPARLSYWNGCSGGGREGLLQAARFPDEFDGVIAGDPADVRRNGWALWLANETYKDPEAYIPSSKYAMIHQFVLDACDAKDGLKDGLIENPLDCHPRFAKLACRQGDGTDCLTPKQVHSAETLVSPAVAGGHQFFPGLAPGTELRWARMSDGKQPGELFYDQFRYVVYGDPKWDWKSFDLARDETKADAIDAETDGMRPDLSAFAKHGGKLLLYHGWADQQVAPGSTVEFFEAASKKSPDPAKTADWMRFFMAPGMGHCSGGEGPDSFDKADVMERWVEGGKAPDRIVASHKTAGKVDRTRPLCPYPQSAHYKGSGSIDEAANFECR